MRETITNPKLLALYDYWDKKRSGRPMPSRKDIDVLELGPWLGNVALLDVLEDGRDYFCRVHGSEMRRFSGIDLTGMRLLEIPHDWKHEWAREFTAAVTTRAPFFISRKSSSAKELTMVSKLVLPLSDDGALVNKILVAVYREKVD